jgi:hypothetical protein
MDAQPTEPVRPFPFTLRTLLVVTTGFALLLGLVIVPHFRNLQQTETCKANLKQITFGLADYDNSKGSLPAAYSVDAQGRRMHSWRAHLSPQIDPDWPKAGDYKWDEPWDGPNNSMLHYAPKPIYSCPADPARDPRMTSYVAVVGPHTVWPGEKSRSYESLRNGLSNVVTVAEAANSGIHWMEPRDLEFDKIDFSVNGRAKPGISSAKATVPTSASGMDTSTSSQTTLTLEL